MDDPPDHQTHQLLICLRPLYLLFVPHHITILWLLIAAKKNANGLRLMIIPCTLVSYLFIDLFFLPIYPVACKQLGTVLDLAIPNRISTYGRVMFLGYGFSALTQLLCTLVINSYFRPS